MDSVGLHFALFIMSAHEYTQEQYESDCRERNRLFREKWGREMTFDDVLASFGGYHLGQTEALPDYLSRNRFYPDDGIVEQT